MSRFTVARWLIGAALAIGLRTAFAAPPATRPAAIDQAAVDRAMQRLRERDASRPQATTRPAPVGSAPVVEPGVRAYSDTEVEKFRRAFVAQQITVSQSAAKSHDRQRVQQAVEARRVMSAAPAEELRDLLQNRDARNAPEEARVAKKFADPRRVATAVCDWMRKSGQVRSARPHLEDFSGKPITDKEFAVDVEFEFETKGGLLRHHTGWIRFQRLSLPYPVPIAANIDGVDDEFKNVGFDAHDDVILLDFTKSFAGSYSRWDIGIQDGHLTLYEREGSVD
jgi:hypothetical protein